MAETTLLRSLVGGAHPGARVVLPDGTLTHADLLAAARALAPAFAGQGRVAALAQPTRDFVTTLVSATLDEVTLVPVPDDLGDRELDHILGDSGAVAVGALADRVRSTGAPLESAGALMLYTSGTTGAPKGVPISAAGIVSCLDGLADAWSWTADDVLVHGLPLNHVHGLVLGLLGALHHGCDPIHTGRPTPAAYAASAAAGGTLFFGVPTVWGRVAADGGRRGRWRPLGCSSPAQHPFRCRSSSACAS